MLVAKNHQKFRSRCLVDEFSLTDLFNDINHLYRADLLKKKYFWMPPFFIAVATYCYDKKVRGTMRSVTVSYLLEVRASENLLLSWHLMIVIFPCDVISFIS